MKIVVLDGKCGNPGDLSWEPLYALGDLTVYDTTSPDELMERAKDADVILTNKVVFDASLIASLPQLKYIGVLATGYNVIDVKAAREHGVIVTNIPAYSTEDVAQSTFAHILNITNQVGHYAREVHEGVWSRQDLFCYWNTPLMELSGKTLGIVGLGSIGMRVAEIAHCFGMHVYAYTSKRADGLPFGIQKTTLDGLLAVSDILSLHCPLNDDTRELINKDTLSKMKQGAILINTGRGPLVNEQDVADALENGQLMAYGADVMCQEPPEEDNPLLCQPHAYITPHIAWATVEARQRLLNIAFENVRAFLSGSPIHVVS